MLLLDLPSEVLLLILSQLDIHQILSLRQTCSSIANLTRDRRLWLQLLQKQEGKLPLPLTLRGENNTSRHDLPPAALEEIVTSNNLVDELWSLPRQSGFRKLQPKMGNWLLGLEVFLDRWVLAVHGDGYLNVWDLEVKDPRGWASFTIEGDHYSSYIYAFDAKTLKVTLAAVTSSTSSPIRRTAIIYEIHLSEKCPATFKVICTFSLSSSWMILRLDISKRFLAFSHLCTITIFRWRDDCHDESELDSCNIRAYLEEREEMFTTIHSLEFIDPYMFVLKTRSVEIHPLPPQFRAAESPPDLPMLRHEFRTYSFREFSVGEVEKTGDYYVVKFLASDIVQGLFFFSATITFHSSAEASPTFRVDLLYVYPTVLSIPVRRLKPRVNATSSSGGISGHLVLDTGHVRSPFFVSAFAMGPQAMRGMWIERRRGTMAKHILTCRFADTEMEEEVQERQVDADADGADLPFFLDGSIVYTFKSFDLNEDLMHCAFGEVGGNIVVGNRSGDVLLLDIEA